MEKWVGYRPLLLKLFENIDFVLDKNPHIDILCEDFFIYQPLNDHIFLN